MNYLDDLESAYEIGVENKEIFPVLERAIAGADVSHDVETGVEARDLMIEAACFQGYPRKQLQAFSWVIKKYEEDESSVDEYNLLWQYKWISESLASFEEVSKDQIQALQEDMKAKYLASGYSLAPYYKVKTLTAMYMGDREETLRYFKKWQTTPTDFMNDCVACEAHEVAHYYWFVGDYENAVKAAKPILNGHMGCAEIPHLTYGLMALTYLELGEIEKAEVCLDKGLPLVQQSLDLLEGLAQLIEYMIRTDRHEQALEIFESHREMALNTEGSLVGLHLLSAIYPIVTDEDLKEKTRELAAKFDRRNGNDYYTAQLKNS
ncbi:hypothetical protein [Listeria costaricensis]|uniref:hypothetical protein n=1 Tax=Listeria costaricensis TaxID=2026604 RepID=UPI000C072243|nr:hypothetical protein [Listeria costaricensis]